MSLSAAARSVVDASKKWQRIQDWVARDSGAALSAAGGYDCGLSVGLS